VAEEVRKAKAEAWQEGVNFALPNAETTWYPQHNPYRATHYPEGDPVTDHPIDTEARRARAEHDYRHGGPANAIESLAANIPEILDRLADAEHRATRAEAQSAIRGRAVAIYQRRAREAETERDWNWRSSRHSKIERIRAIARADRAEAEARAQRRRADDMRSEEHTS